MTNDEHDGTSGPTTRPLREKLVFARASRRQRIVFFAFLRLVQKCMSNAGDVLHCRQKRMRIARGQERARPGSPLPVAMLTRPKVINSRGLTVNHLDLRGQS